MKRLFQFAVLALAALSVASCKEKKSDDIIIIRKPAAARQNAPQRMGDTTERKTVKWVGAEYKLTVSRKADTSLPLAADGGIKYYDNRITISIERTDGTVFFNRTFTKSDFRPYVDKMYYDNGALVGIVFDKVDGTNMLFAASVGSPDKSSDEIVPLTVTVSSLGAVTIDKSAME